MDTVVFKGTGRWNGGHGYRFTITAPNGTLWSWRPAASSGKGTINPPG